VLIREATQRDDHAIGELLVRAFEETYRVKMPEVKIGENRKAALRAVAEKRAVAKVWVAEEGGRVVGTVSVWPAGAEGSEAFVPGAADLRHLAVEASQKGRGTSKALMDTAEKWARDSGATAVCLHVRRGVHGLARMYMARGYVRVPSGDLDKLPDVFLEAYALSLPP